MKQPIRISASRLKNLKDCSLSFWYSEIQKLPQATHWKTKVGTVSHLLFETILLPRRAALFRAILATDAFDITLYPQLVRFVAWQLRRMEVTLSSVEEVGRLVRVAFTTVKPHFDAYFAALDAGKPAPFRYYTEKRFQMQVGEAVMSGFIDLLLVWPDRAQCWDLKTQREKFARADVPNNVQAILYQLACFREFGLIPAVEFIMLRHPPTARHPSLHIQRVESPSPAHLTGLEHYIEEMYQLVNQFGMKEALSHTHDDEGFCFRVCPYYKPFTYWALMDGDEVDKTFLTPPTEVPKDRTLVELHHKGCLAKWRPT